MANDPAFLFYPGDYLRDTQTLSENTQVAYDRIMCEHMRNISTDMNNIGITKEKLNFFTKRLSDDEKNELLHILHKNDYGYQIEWVALSISKRKTYSQSRAENRKGKKKEDMKTHDVDMENENEDSLLDSTKVKNGKQFKDFKSPGNEIYDRKFPNGVPKI